jgi:hypothetical protein
MGISVGMVVSVDGRGVNEGDADGVARAWQPIRTSVKTSVRRVSLGRIDFPPWHDHITGGIGVKIEYRASFVKDIRKIKKSNSKETSFGDNRSSQESEKPIEHREFKEAQGTG